MADIEKERALFEAFHSGRKNKGREYRETLFTRLADDSYAEVSVQRHWWTWQNARALPPADAAEMKRLADALEAQSQGIEEWRVADPKTGAYCMHFALDICIDPERSAREWLRKHIEEFPRGRFIGHEVRRVIVQTEAQETATAAAALLRRMAGEDA